MARSEIIIIIIIIIIIVIIIVIIIIIIIIIINRPDFPDLIIWSSSHSLLDLKLFRSATNHYHAAITKAKKLYNSSLISSNLHNSRKLWHTINHLLHRIAAPSLPSSNSLSSLPQSFATFFPNKIHKLRTSILTGSTTPSPHFPPPFKPPDLSK